MKMTNEEVVKLNRKYNLFSWSIQGTINPMPMERGEGIYIFDAEGRRYIDLCAQLVNCNIGHQHPKAIAALKEQADKLTFAAPGFANSTKGKVAKKIIDLLPDNFGKVFFTNAGADANENAIKIARYFTGKNKIISRYRSYHGATAGAITLTGDPRRWPAEPGIPGVIKCFDPYCYRCPFGQVKGNCKLECATHIDEILMYEGPNVAAIFIETVTGTNGIITPPEGYLPKLREICDKHQVLLICDEVMAGWGRTGKTFAFENYGIKPDIVTMAKGLTCGYVPLGAVAVSSAIAEYFEDHMLSAGLTYSGHTLALGTADRVIDIYQEENLIEHSRNIGQYVGDRLNELMSKHVCVGDVRGIGLFRTIELVYNRQTKEPMCPFGGGPSPLNELGKFLKEKQIITMIHWNMIMFNPPLIITKEQVDEIINVLDEGLTLMDKYVK